MAKGKSKNAAAPNVKAAVSTAALLASGASAKELLKSETGEKEVVVASFHLSRKQDLNDDPPPNLAVTEKVIAETVPFQMIRQQRSMAEYGTAVDNVGGEMTTARHVRKRKGGEIETASDSEKAKKKKEKKKKKEGKKKDKKDKKKDKKKAK